MPRTTAEKLQIKPDSVVHILGGSPEKQQLLHPLPTGVQVQEGVGEGAEVAVIFAEDRSTLDTLLDQALASLTQARATWIGYPKGNRADINRDSIWARVEELGWTATANVSLDEVWSAVRIKPVD